MIFFVVFSFCSNITKILLIFNNILFFTDYNERVGSVFHDLEVAKTLLANLTLEDLEEQVWESHTY